MAQSYYLRKKKEREIINNISVLRAVPVSTAKVVEMASVKLLPNIHTTHTFPLYSGSKEICSIDGWDSK